MRYQPVDVDIQFGWSGKELHAHNPDISFDQDGVVGAVFHEVSDISTGKLPIVHLTTSHGREITLPLARSLFIPIDAGRGYKLNEISLDLKLPGPPDKSADDAAWRAFHKKVYDIYRDTVARIRKAGWRRFYDPNQARMTGVSTYRFESGYKPDGYIPNDIHQVAPDPYYPITFEEFLHPYLAIDLSWYAPDALITLSYDPTAGGPLGSEISINIINDQRYILYWDPNGHGSMEESIAAYKKDLPKYLQARERREAKARKLGIPLDESYEDPAIYGIPVTTQ